MPAFACSSTCFYFYGTSFQHFTYVVKCHRHLLDSALSGHIDSTRLEQRRYTVYKVRPVRAEQQPNSESLTGGYSRLPGIGLSYPARYMLHRLAGRYDSRIPESTISPQSGTKNLATGPCAYCRISAEKSQHTQIAIQLGKLDTDGQKSGLLLVNAPYWP